MIILSDYNKRKKKRGIREYLPIILKKLKIGLKPKDLDNRFNQDGIPHDTLYEIIKLLDQSEIIYKDDDGRYYYIWKKGIREFSGKNYKIALNHSKRFFTQEFSEKLLMECVIQGNSLLKLDDDRLLYDKYFIQHLETGYPEIYEIYRKWLENKTDEVYSELEARINFLLEKILNGEPLRGYCDLCPMVIVK